VAVVVVVVVVVVGTVVVVVVFSVVVGFVDIVDLGGTHTSPLCLSSAVSCSMSPISDKLG
jgi:hypothetical protein